MKGLLALAMTLPLVAGGPAFADVRLTDLQMDAVSGGAVCIDAGACGLPAVFGSPEWAAGQVPVINNTWTAALANWTSGAGTFPVTTVPVVKISVFGRVSVQ